MGKLDTALKKLQKRYEGGVIMDLRKQGTIPQVERVPVDSPKIGDAFGFGGYPKGRIIEIFGAESGGKTSLCSYLAGCCQRTDFQYTDDKEKTHTRKGMVLFIDAEHAFDVEYAKVQGFDMSRCILVQPDNGEQALDIAIEFITTGEMDMVVIDSIAALTPQAEIEADMDAQQIGLQARMLSKFLRKATALIAQTKSTLVCTNQTRDVIGSRHPTKTTPGGNALKFYSSVRIEVRRKEYIEEKNETVGIVIALKVVKNKTAPPMKKYLINLSFTDGIDSHLEWVDFAISYDVIQNPKSGSYVLVSGEMLRGKAKVEEYYADPANQTEYDTMVEKTKERMFAMGSFRVSADDPDEAKEIAELEGDED